MGELKVIGAGLGRTGTESLKTALEHLGFGKCYHMFELMNHPEHLVEWKKLQRGDAPDFDALFSGYSSCTDFPSAMFYRQFMERYPNAKVILTTRDADRWFTSASKTIFRHPPMVFFVLMRFFGLFSNKARSVPDIMRFARELVHDDFFRGTVHDRERAKAIFNDWNQRVKETVPPERLLVFEVADGWSPLCKFLNVPVPTVPFPRSNESGSFRTQMVGRVAGRNRY